MKLSLGLRVGSRVLGSLDSNAVAYADAVVAAGGTVSSSQRAALSAFVTAEKAAGRWSTLKRLFLPIWADADANAIDLKTLETGTWVGTVTHGAGFAKGNGTTGYLNSGVSNTSAGLATSSSHLFALIKTASGGTSRAIIGSGAGVNNMFLRADTSAFLVGRYFGISVGQISGSTTASGILSFSYFSGTRYLFRRATAGRSTIASASAGTSGALTLGKIYLMALNNTDVDSVTPTNFSDAEFGAFGFGLGLSDADDAAFSSNLKTMWESLTGLSLP